MNTSVPEAFKCPISFDLMSDPVTIVGEGRSYDRKSLEEWINKNHTSPLTRKFVSLSDIIPNYNLKDLIDEWKKSSLTPPTSTSTPAPTAPTTIPTVLKEELDASDSIILSSPEYPGQRTSLNLCVIIDTSGSMGTIISTKEKDGLTRLDLVKHCLNVLAKSLSNNDFITLIEFSSQAKVGYSGPVSPMVFDKIKSLDACGGTNVWPAILLAQQHITSQTHIMLFTDGEVEEPPRGFMTELESLKWKVPINTFGFSNEINSQLLYKIADYTHGVFGFIPDYSMLGTTMINYIASVLSSCRITEYGNCLWGWKKEIIKTPSTTTPTTPQVLRQKFIHLLVKLSTNYLPGLLQDNVDDVNKLIEEFNEVDANCPILLDLKGQVLLLASNNSYHQNWGRHYVLSLASAHYHQICMNFRDPGIQQYGKFEPFMSFQNELNDIFNNYPPPVPSGSWFSGISTSSASSGQNKSRGSGGTKHARHYAPVSMRSYNDIAVTCFDGNGVVMTENGPLKVMDLKKGMQVINSGKIECIIKNKVNGLLKMVTLNGVKITEWHPVKLNDTWTFPVDVKDSKEEYVDYVYSILFENRALSIMVNGLEIICLAHGKSGPVIGHYYFGTERIVEDIKKVKGFNEGVVVREPRK